jgi:hypothetical protein
MKDAAMTVPEQCTRLPALTVSKNVKFHSSRPRADQSTVENASRSIEDTRKTDPCCKVG